MASIISVDTLQDSAGSNEITTANVKTAFDDRVKAWANLNGTGTIALRDSVNVASVTDNGTGIYTFNFSNDMANTNYSTTSASRNRATGSNNSYTATSSKRIELWEPASSPALSDTDEIAATIHGDLA